MTDLSNYPAIAALIEQARIEAERAEALCAPFRQIEDLVRDISLTVSSLRYSREFSLPDYLDGLRESLKLSEEVLVEIGASGSEALAGIASDIARLTDSLLELVVSHDASPIASAPGLDSPDAGVSVGEPAPRGDGFPLASPEAHTGGGAA